MPPVRKFETMLLVASVLIAPAPAAARSLPDFSMQDMHYVQETGKVAVGVTPYFPQGLVKKAFGINLLRRGILPVYLVIENRGPTHIRLQVDGISIEDVAGNNWQLLPANQVIPRSRTNPFLRGFGNLGIGGALHGIFTESISKGAMFGGVLGVAGVAGTLVGNAKRDRYIREISYHGAWLAPSSKTGGVLFFKRSNPGGRFLKIGAIGNLKVTYALEEKDKEATKGELAFNVPAVSEFTKQLSKDCRERGFGVGTHLGFGVFPKDAGTGPRSPWIHLGLEAAYDVNKHVAPFADFSLILGFTDRDVSQTVRNIKQTFYIFDTGAYYSFFNGPVTPYVKAGIGLYKLLQKEDGNPFTTVVPDVGVNFHGQGAAGLDFSVARRHRIQLEGRWDYFDNGAADMQAVHFGVGYRFVF